MEFRESISVIVDGRVPHNYTESIAFMKELGLKCDCVGWTYIELDSEEKFELIKRMRKKADEQKVKLRCQGYQKKLVGKDADWFFLRPRTEVKGDDREWEESEYGTSTIKGYKLPKGSHVIEIVNLIGASEKFIGVCRELKLTGVDFMWVTDRGKYDAAPYFYIVPEKAFCRGIDGYGDDFRKPKSKLSPGYRKFLLNCRQVDSDGSHMEELASLFDQFQYPTVPMMVDRNCAPDTDFAFYGASILIRKPAVEALIAKGVLKWVDLEPATYFDEEKHSRLIYEYTPEEYMPDFIKEKHASAYEKWKMKKRTPFNPKEKDALKLMRSAKKELPEYYNKPLKKAIIENLTETPYAPMLPYYKISNGCAINDEIDILPYEDVEEATAEFMEDLQAEELIMEDMPELMQSVAIGTTANGDTILLKKDGTVLRYDHEDPYLSGGWDSLHSFFFEEIEVE